MKGSTKGPMRLPEALKYLTKEAPKHKRMRAESIAHHLNVSYGTIASWMSERRKPKKGAIIALEYLSGLKICE